MDYEQMLREMTLPEKVGQLMMLAFSGQRLEQAQVMFEQHVVGAAYISNENAPSPQAAAELAAQLQALAQQTRLRLPLLLGVDHEGAWSVMTPGSVTGPGNLAIGATDEPRNAYDMYRVLGQELAAVGLNVLLAPCADCNSNPHNSIIGMRSFGQEAQAVAEMVVAAVHGARAGGVMATLKHLPGHGDTQLDSHRGLPTVARSRDELRRIDLLPFAAGIRAGAEIVMTSHILFTAYDAANPATLSPTILQGLLRQEMGFDGLIVSDSMNMGAIKRHYAPAEAAVRALRAGVDMLMLAEEHYDHDASRYIAQQSSLIEAVIQAVEAGELPAERVDDAVRRVLRCKAQIAPRAAQAVSCGLESVGSAEHRRIERDIARRAITVVCDENALAPLPAALPITLVNTTWRASYAPLTRTRGIGPNQATPAFDAFAEALRARRGDIRIVTAEQALAQGADLDLGAGVVLAVTENYTLPGMDFDQSTQGPILATLCALAPERLMVVGLRDPYELAHLPAVRTYLSACSSRPCAAEAAAAVLCGECAAQGRLPVQVE